MWWLTIPAVGMLGKLIVNAAEKPAAIPARLPARPLGILEQNLERLRNELRGTGATRVAILGQPGAGKSSLLKKMTKGRVRPLPVIGIQTDATDWAQRQDCDLLSVYKDFVFVDVPGYDTASHPTDTFVRDFPFGDVDVFLFVVRGKLRGADERVFARIADSGKPVCVARSFAESCDDDERGDVSADLQRRLGLDDEHHIGFFSNRSGEGCIDIFDAIVNRQA
jgi:GTPase Era involved in 16S rRNA processing